MFNNLKRAIQNRPITMKSYAELLGVTEKTLQNKMNGVTEFSWAEVEKTCTFLFPEYDYKYLFDRNS